VVGKSEARNEMELLRGFGPLFYLVDPKELTAERIEDAPNFTAKAIPYVFLLGVIEAGKSDLLDLPIDHVII
jgi:hypothetical protein